MGPPNLVLSPSGARWKASRPRGNYGTYYWPRMNWRFLARIAPREDAWGSGVISAALTTAASLWCSEVSPGAARYRLASRAAA
jgi:hypothetical protein